MEDYIDPKILEDGSVLLYFKDKFLENRREDNLFVVLSCLRDSQVIVPMNASISKEDEELFLKAKVGDRVSTHNDVRLKPDILQNGEKFFFPIFSNVEQIPEEYRSRFSIINLSVLQCIDMAKSYEKVCGLVLDAFTKAMVLEYDIADLILQLESRLPLEE